MTATTDAAIAVAYLTYGAVRVVSRYRLRFTLWRSTWQEAGEW